MELDDTVLVSEQRKTSQKIVTRLNIIFRELGSNLGLLQCSLGGSGGDTQATLVNLV